MDNLVNRGSHFELVIYKARGKKPKVREVNPMYLTSAEYAKTFCPVSILSAYCTARKNLCPVEGEGFLFPKMSSSFKKAQKGNY